MIQSHIEQTLCLTGRPRTRVLLASDDDMSKTTHNKLIMAAQQQQHQRRNILENADEPLLSQQQRQRGKRQEEHGDLAMSYYILYAEIMAAGTSAAARTIGPAAAAAVAFSSSSLDKSSSSSSASVVASPAAVVAASVWEEDEWTEEDERRATQELCTRNHYDDDDDDWQEHQQYVKKDLRQQQLSEGGVDKNKNIDENADADTVAWNRFYRLHRANFFKDRHYLLETFPHEFLLPRTVATTTTGKHDDDDDDENNQDDTDGRGRGGSNNQHIMVEFGCGVGNAAWPVLAAHTSGGSASWTVIGVDLSPTAIALFQNDERFRRAQQENRAHAFVMDITTGRHFRRGGDGADTAPRWPEDFRRAIGDDGADVATLLFCLSAIHPHRHALAVRNVLAALRPGGVVIVRDYGRYDHAQFQLHSRQRNYSSSCSSVVHFYQKHDGTKVYYFTTDDLRRLFCANLGGGDDDHDDDNNDDCCCCTEILECRYLRRVYRNRATGQARRRVWVQARFRKTITQTEKQHERMDGWIDGRVPVMINTL